MCWQRAFTQVLAVAVLCGPLTVYGNDGDRVVAARTAVYLPLTAGPAAISLRKVVDPRTGAARLESSHPGITSYPDLRRAQAAERQALRQRYGCLDRSLHARFGRMADSDTLRVGIELRTPAVRYLSRFRHSEAELKAQSVALCRVRPYTAPEALVDAYGLRGAEVSGRWVACTVTRRTLARLARDPAVSCVSALDPGVPCGTAEPFWKLAAEALNPAAHPSDLQGQGVNAAIVEPQTGDHLVQTTACLKNAAPAARYFYKETGYYNMFSTDDWLVANEIGTSSLSMSRTPEMRTPHEGDFLLMDDFAYRWPCPVFCTPAGNGGPAEEVNWQQYTGISVGSVKYWQEREYRFDPFTSTRNPNPVASACLGGDTTDCGGDRELPELLTPGSHPYEPVGVGDTSFVWYTSLSYLYCSAPENPDSTYVCGYYPVDPWFGSGTSYAAPIANGIAARLISSNRPLLAHRPDAVKMVLMLTAHNVDSGYWDCRVDGRDGAGVVSAYDAVAYAVGCTDLTGQASPAAAESGFYTAERDTGMTEETFRVRIPDDPPDGRHLRVVLVWTSTPDLDSHYNAASDLDLGAFVSDSGTYGSYSLDATVEMFDVPRAAVTPGREYTFKVLPTDIRIPAGARTDFFYHTVGWTWVRDHADSGSVAAVAPSGPSRLQARPVVAVRAVAPGTAEVRVRGTGSSAPVRVRVTDLRGRLLQARQSPVGPDGECCLRLELGPAAAGLRIVTVDASGRRLVAEPWVGR